MLQITPQMKILVAVEPADFRKGIDGLAQVCQEVLQHDPFGGQVFVFRNRPATALKVLVYDGQGFWLCHKKHESDCPPTFLCTRIGQRAHNLARRLIAASGMDASTANRGPRRCPMPKYVALIAPPRARWPSRP